MGSDLFAHQTELLERAIDLATLFSREFELVGLNGIDFIARKGIPYPTEINPRFSASMELLEGIQHTSMFEVHANACRGRLPRSMPALNEVRGKAVVFARRPVRIAESRFWHSSPEMADLPHSGERIDRGRPVCTVFAAGATPHLCRALLVRKAAAVYRASESLRQAS